MSKPFTPKVVTANALLEGDVIYLTAHDQWSRDLQDAQVITDAAHGDARLDFAHAQAGTIVGAYLADVTQTEQGPQPVHFREEFRTKGPSNYAHGKQELA